MMISTLSLIFGLCLTDVDSIEVYLLYYSMCTIHVHVNLYLVFQFLVEFSDTVLHELIYSSHTSNCHYHGESFELLIVV